MINVGIIGAGLIGKKRAEALNKFDDSRLSVTADVNQNAAENLAKDFGGDVETDWRQVIKRRDVNAVIVATYNKFLAPISIAALKNRKHVLCEKPLGRNSDESKKIIEACTNGNLVLKTGFNHRHHPAISKAKKLAQKGKIGNIYYMRCVYGHGGRLEYEKEWRANKNLCGGGELLDQGVHVVDLFRWFFGEFDEVYGQIETFYWDMKVEDNAFATFRTKTGQIAVMHTSWTQWKNKFLFEVFGEKGYLIVNGLGGSYGIEKLRIGKRRMKGDNGNARVEDQVQYVGGPPDEEVIEFQGPDISWIEEWKEFVSAIKENREPIGSGYDGLMANRLIAAIYQSAKLNKTVKI